MKKTVLAALLLMVSFSVWATNFTIGSFKKLPSTTATAVIAYTPAVTDSVWWYIELNTTSTFTGVPAFTATDSGITVGPQTDTITVPSGLVSWARIRSKRRISGIWVHDTSAAKRMLRNSSVSGVPSASMTQIRSVITADNGNDTAFLSCTLGYDSLFTTSVTYATRMLTGYGPVTVYDTVPYVLVPNTDYWIRYSLPNGVGIATQVVHKKTLSTILPPFVGAGGTPSATPTTITVPVNFDGYGYAATAVGLIRPTTATVWQDSVAVLVDSTISGTQALTFIFTGKIPATSYVITVRGKNAAGVTYLATITVSTLPPTSMFSLANDTAYAVGLTGVHYGITYSNVPGSSCHVTLALEKAGTILYTADLDTAYATGIFSTEFSVPDTGVYHVYAWGFDLPAGTSLSTDTLTVHVTPAPSPTGIAHIDGANVTMHDGVMQLYSITGAVVYRKEYRKGEHVVFPQVIPGIYIACFTDVQGFRYTPEKIYIQ